MTETRAKASAASLTSTHHAGVRRMRRVMVTAWWMGLLAATMGALLVLARRLRARRDERALARFGATWGQVVRRPRDMHGLGLYARLTGEGAPGSVDDRTWRDLDLDAVFAHVDRTTTSVGQQILYARLRNPPKDSADRAGFDALVRRLGRDRALRERAHLALLPLAALGASTLAMLFTSEPIRLSKRWLPPLLTGVTLGSLGLVALHGAFLLAVLACFGMNLGLRFKLWQRLSLLREPMRELDALLAAGGRLAAPELAELGASAARVTGALDGLGKLSPLVSWVAGDRAASNEIAAVVAEYLNVFLLLDVNACGAALDILDRHRSRLRDLYEAIGGIDAALSAASVREDPRCGGALSIEEGGPLVLEGAVHPLVSEAVPSDVALAHRGLFITGSNMSGKSTYLKSIGVNVILAQGLGASFASGYRAPFLTVRSLIVGGDSITEGKSYYLAEVHAARERLEALAGEGRHLVLVDEPFRGTNTDERVGASKAYLEALVRAGAFTVAASHDQELGELLAETFEEAHFTEQVRGDDVVFDYTLRPGPCTSRNALRVLELAGFAPELVGEARRVAGAARRSA